LEVELGIALNKAYAAAGVEIGVKQQGNIYYLER
jgi:hypothetical protein